MKWQKALLLFLCFLLALWCLYWTPQNSQVRRLHLRHSKTMPTTTIPATPSTYGPYTGTPIVSVSFAIPAGMWTAGQFIGTSAATQGSLNFYPSDAPQSGFQTLYGVVPFNGGSNVFTAAALTAAQAAAGGTWNILMLGGDNSSGITVTNIALVLTGTPSVSPPTVTLDGPATVCAGSGATLTYSSLNASTLTLTPGSVSLPVNSTGFYTTAPLATGTVTFTLAAVGPGGTASATKTVNVVNCSCQASASLAFAPPVVDVECTLTASPPSITQGQSCNLLVTTLNARLCAINEDVGPVPLSSSGTALRAVSPDYTTTYVETVQGPWLTQAQAQATVTVLPPDPTDPCACDYERVDTAVCGGWNKVGC